MTGATLFFGIGATKAGTSWLHAWLAAHPEVHLWRHKEIHYFDAFDLDRVTQQVAAARRRRDTLAARREAATDAARRADLDDAVAEFDRYLALMAPGRIDAAAYLAFLSDRAGNARVLGDVTPAYGLLGTDRLRFMARLGAVTRFVYLLRDPVERLWSNVRAMAALRAGGEVGSIPARARHIFDRWAQGEEAGLAQRCDYAGTLRRLFAAVPERDRLVAFHEELFSPGTVARICAFLGIAPAPAPVAVPVNRGPEVALDARRRGIAARRLARQYAEVKSIIGRVPDRWQPMGVEV